MVSYFSFKSTHFCVLNIKEKEISVFIKRITIPFIEHLLYARQCRGDINVRLSPSPPEESQVNQQVQHVKATGE